MKKTLGSFVNKSSAVKALAVLAVLVLVVTLIPVKAKAAGGIYPAGSVYIGVGETGGFSVIAENATGRVDVWSNDGGVASAGGSAWLDCDSTWISVYGVAPGTTTITVQVSDGATYDEEDCSGTYYVSVTVVAPAAPEPANNGGSGGASNTSNANLPALSNNTALSALTVKGYDVIANADGTYALTVPYNVDSVEIEASAEDAKASVAGTGARPVAVGDNALIVSVTAENGAVTEYTVNIKRKDAYYMDDFDAVLTRSTSDKPLEVRLAAGDTITEEMLNQIYGSDKAMIFSVYDTEGNLLFSWTVNDKEAAAENAKGDGTAAPVAVAFNPAVSFEASDSAALDLASNYAKGMSVSLAHAGALPENTVIKVKAQTPFKNGDVLKLYVLNKETGVLDLLSEGLPVTEGFIEFPVNQGAEYFLTQSTIIPLAGPEEEAAAPALAFNPMIIGFILAGVELIAIVVLVVLLVKKSKKAD